MSSTASLIPHSWSHNSIYPRKRGKVDIWICFTITEFEALNFLTSCLNFLSLSHNSLNSSCFSNSPHDFTLIRFHLSLSWSPSFFSFSFPLFFPFSNPQFPFIHNPAQILPVEIPPLISTVHSISLLSLPYSPMLNSYNG